MPNAQVKDPKANIPPDLPLTKDLGWMTEAKDWAGELISGQSTTGRILVSLRLTSGYLLIYDFRLVRLSSYSCFQSHL